MKPSESNRFNAMVAELGLCEVLRELRMQAQHFADVDDDEGRRIDAEQWDDFRRQLATAETTAVGYGLKWPRPPNKKP